MQVSNRKGQVVQVEFVGKTVGLILPEVVVFSHGKQLEFEIGVTATNCEDTPRDLLIPERGRHATEPWRRELRQYLTTCIALPWLGCKHHQAWLYQDGKGHHHVKCAAYDFALIAGYAAFLRVAQEENHCGRKYAEVAELIRQGDSDHLFSGFVSTEFVRESCSLIRAHAGPWYCDVGCKLAEARQAALKLQGKYELPKLALSDRTLVPPRVTSERGSQSLHRPFANALAQLVPLQV